MKYVVIAMMAVVLVACKGDQEQKVTYQKTGDEIIDALSQQIEEAPLVPQHYYQRANALYEREDYALAIEDLQKAIAIDSLNPDYYHLLADSYLDYYRSKEALETMRALLKIYPTRVPSLLKLAEMEYIVQRHDVSIYNCNLILKDNPQNAEAFFMIGLNFRALKEVDKAIGAFQTAVEFDPDLIDAWQILGDLYAEKGDKKAVDYYNSAILLAPDQPQPRHSKAYYLQNNGDIPGAIRLYREIVVSNPDYAMAYLNSGILYLQQDSLDKAYEQFDILAGRQPENANAYFYRAQVQFIKGDMAAAKADLQNTLRLNPEDVQAQELLQDVEKELAEQ